MKKKNLLVLPLLLSFAFAPDEAGAAYMVWSSTWCGSGSWTNGSCWPNGDGASPADGDSVSFFTSGAGYTVDYGSMDQNGSANISLQEITVGRVSDPGSATLRIADPRAWIEAGMIRIGFDQSFVANYPAYGSIIQETGVVSVQAGLYPDAYGVGSSGSLAIGLNSVGTSSYTLSGGSLYTATTRVGTSGSGLFIHDSAAASNATSALHQTGTLMLGDYGGSHGTYNLGFGRLVSIQQIVGNVGTGEFTQSAPLNSYNETGALYVGNFGSGVYTMQGGWLFAGSETIGNYGTGTFTHWGGLNDVTGDLTVGDYGNGAYAMNGMFGGNPELRAMNEFIGRSGTGSFEQFGGTNIVAGNLNVGHDRAGLGTYILDGWGTLSVAGDEAIGSSGTGAFTQIGGMHTVGGQLNVGLYSTGSGTLTLNDWGQIYAAGIQVGAWGTGTFTQNQGDVTASSLVIGRDTGSSGTYNLNMGRLEAAHITVGMDGTGVFNQTDGQNRYFGTGSLSVGAGSGNGTYNLSGGWVGTTDINVGTGSGTGTFNHTGSNVSADATLTIGANGTYNMTDDGSSWLGPRLYANTIVNNGTVNFNGGEIQTAGGICSYCGEGPFPTNILNNGTFNIGGAGEREISGVTVNNGTMKITDTTVRFNREFTNNGAYLSDPSTNRFTSLTVGASGYLVGGTGDNFLISDDFFNYSTQTGLWNTADAYLRFYGWNTHEFHLGGWDEASSRRFSWDTLELSGSGNLFFSGGPGAALYVDNLILGNGTSLNLNGINLYYTSLTDLGGSFYGGQLIHVAGNTGGGSIPAVPEPPMVLLLASGLAGLLGMRGLRRYRWR